jgi:hypothetical protein
MDLIVPPMNVRDMVKTQNEKCGPVGWALEWGASLALGAVITAWICGEVYLGPSHDVMTPAVVMICMQRLTLAGEGLDIVDFMEKIPPKQK